jgi:hypothetical protein
MKFTFGVKHTKHGCTVWMDGPTGKRRTARFRNGYASALASAEKWVWEHRQTLKECAVESGHDIEFDVPPELDRKRYARHILQPVDWWEAVDAAAKDEGMTPSEWICNAAKSKLPPEVAKKLSEW